MALWAVATEEKSASPDGLKKQSTTFSAAIGGQVNRQTLLAEGFLDIGEQSGQIEILRVDFVDYDSAAEFAVLRPLHHAMGNEFNAVLRVDHDRGGLDCRQRADGLAHEVRIAGSVDQMNVGALVVEVDHGGTKRVLMLFFEGIEVADRGAALDASWRGDGAGPMEQRFREARLAGARVAYERNGPECFSAVLGHGLLLQ